MTDQTTAVSERKAAEQEYSITVFDYVLNPVGSYKWCLFWDGWQAALKHAQQVVESEREKALEEVAQAIDASGLDQRTMFAWFVRGLKSQQPAPADKDKP